MAGAQHSGSGLSWRLGTGLLVGALVYGLLRLAVGWHPYLAAVAALLATDGAYRLACQRASAIGGAANRGWVVSNTIWAYLAPLLATMVVYWALKGLGWLPGVAFLVALLTGWLMLVLLPSALFEDPPPTFLRGCLVRSEEEARRILAEARARSAPTPEEARALPFWGGEYLPYEAGTAHFLVAGTSGSGKTVTIRLLMQSVLPAIRPGSRHRAVIYDEKQEYLPLLDAMGLEVPVQILNPFDKRCWAWDIAADVNEPAVIDEVASILVPDRPQASQPFFDRAVRRLLRGVMTSFMLTAGGKWELWDVVVAMQSMEHIKRVMDRTAQTRRELQLLELKREARSVMMTAATIMMSYESAAAAWHRVPAGQRVSFTKWVQGEGLLLMSSDPTINEPLAAINQVMFLRLSQLLTTMSTEVEGRTWVFVDEAREAKRLNGLASLLNKGRSQGVCVVLGFQFKEGLDAVYSHEVAEEIAGECNHKAFLRLTTPDSAKWASETIGSVEQIEHRRSWGANTGKNEGQNVNTSETLEVRPAVMPTEFQHLPFLPAGGRMAGWYLTPYTGAYKLVVDRDYLRARLIDPTTPYTIYDRRVPAEQHLGDWHDADLVRLGLVAPLADDDEDEHLSLAEAELLWGRDETPEDATEPGPPWPMIVPLGPTTAPAAPDESDRPGGLELVDLQEAAAPSAVTAEQPAAAAAEEPPAPAAAQPKRRGEQPKRRQPARSKAASPQQVPTEQAPTDQHRESDGQGAIRNERLDF